MYSILEQFKNDNKLYDELSKKIITKTFNKGTVIQRQNDNIQNVYIVIKGCLRSYIIDEKGKEHIFMFAPEGWIISDIESHVKHTPCQLFIDVLEDAEVEIISNENFNELFFREELNSIIGVDKLLKRISVLQKRILLLLSATAIERYNDFIETYPNIVQRVPQKMIASYLGVTPEALSKLRGQKAKNK